MIDYVKQLAARVRDEWARLDLRESELPNVAFEALRELPPPPDFDLSRIVQWGIDSDALPDQADEDSTFGQPPVTLYRDEDFLINALTWLHASTTIHQHGFSGAFHVLHGSSLHSMFSFETTELVNERIKLGRVSLEAVEVLREGDSRRIESGSRFLHSLFHLVHPSMTIVIRNRGDSIKEPQYQYEPPAVAHDPFYRPKSLKRRIELVRLAIQTKNEAGIEAIHRWLRRADFFSAFLILREIGLEQGSIERMDTFFESAATLHGARIDAVRDSLAELLRRWDLVVLRRDVRDTELRLFLALLMNLPDRAAVLAAVRQAHPDREPVESVIDWLGALAGNGTAATVSLPGLDRVSLVVGEQLLRGEDAPVESALTVCRARGIEASRDEVEAACVELPRHPSLRPLFRS